MEVQHDEEKLVVERAVGKGKKSKKDDSAVDAIDEDGETAESMAEWSRSERKRHREKQRRSDVNKGLDQMMALIFLIDPQLKAEAEERARKNQGGRTASENTMLSRVELINSAVATLERVHRENEERKMVIAHLARGLLAGNGSGGAHAPERAPAIPPHLLAALSAQRDIQVRSSYCMSLRGSKLNLFSLFSSFMFSFMKTNFQRQELQQQLNLDALVAASSAAASMQQGRSFLSEAVLGLGSPQRGGAASLARPPASSDLPFAGRNPASASSLSQGYPDSLTSLLQGLEREGLGGEAAIYRALLNRKLQEGEEAKAALASAGLGATGSLTGSGLLGINPALLSRSLDLMGSSIPISGDSIRQAMMRDQTIAAAAAARSQGEKLSNLEAKDEGPPSKRLKQLQGHQD